MPGDNDADRLALFCSIPLAERIERARRSSSPRAARPPTVAGQTRRAS
jgi:hypothetical protein